MDSIKTQSIDQMIRFEKDGLWVNIKNLNDIFGTKFSEDRIFWYLQKVGFLTYSGRASSSVLHQDYVRTIFSDINVDGDVVKKPDIFISVRGLLHLREYLADFLLFERGL